MINDVLKRKDTFSDCKNIDLKSNKIFKGVSPLFLSKNGDFTIFRLVENTSRKSVWKSSKKKTVTVFFNYKNFDLKKAQTLH